MSMEDDKKDAAAVNSNWRVNELMSIEHDEKNTSAINSSWWIDELMSIEHDEKMPRLSTLVDELMNWWAQNMMRKMIRQSTYSLLSFSTRQLVNSSTTLLCPLFSKKFNTMSAIFVHQPLTLPQKIDSREGLFWCKKGLGCECGKMNIYFKKTSFAPDFGLFVAKCTAFWCKIDCILVLNALRFGAKCKVKCC